MRDSAASHVTVNVSNVARSSRFYGVLFDFLGFERIYSGKSGFAYWDGSFSIWFKKGRLAKGFVRGRCGFDHMALRASSRRQVDDLQRLLKHNGARILHPANEYPEYVKGYYAVSFFDPDGIIWELLYLPKKKGAYS